MGARLQKFRALTALLKDLSWWIGLIGAVWSVIFVYIWAFDRLVLLIYFVVSCAGLYAGLRAYIYRRKNRRIYTSFRYIHRLTHNLRNAYQPGGFLHPDQTTAITSTPSEGLQRPIPHQGLKTVLIEIWPGPRI